MNINGERITCPSRSQKPGFNPQFHQNPSISAALRYGLANGMSQKANYLQNKQERIRKKIQNIISEEAMTQTLFKRLKRLGTSG